MVAPVVGQQRNASSDLCGQLSTGAARQAASVTLSPHLSVAANMYGPAGMSLGGNVSMLIPGGSQPLLSVAAVASDVPTLMTQLALAGASLQNSLMATALYNGHGVLPSDQYASSPSVPNTPAQSDNSSVRGAFTQQSSDHDERPGTVDQ